MLVRVTLSMLFVLFWCYLSLGYITRLHCRRHGNFSIIKSDTRFSGTVEKSLEGVTRSECVLSCLTCGCSFINYHPTNLACELMNAQGNESNEAGWQFLSTNYGTRNRGPICRSFSPCEITEACVDTCFEDDQVGYKCIPHQFKQHAHSSASGSPLNPDYPVDNLRIAGIFVQTLASPDGNIILDLGSIKFIRFIRTYFHMATPHLQISIGNLNSRDGNVFCSRVSQVIGVDLVVECSSYLSGRYIVLYHAAGSAQQLSVYYIVAYIDA
ncbi:uncharacterized protein LOC130625705 isoform X2 [Hydractinia symbiolongicarpus]|uniref:uncharacterized protein LOC130625705 isoform X2 n=1 Tax=Hydractinia symbiolongicarpus TaxID=13093 RepID=UPI00254A0377|nr:uncharacterized protein LOC130625705 isoform X2 [Hydractinia symbiolongicarpus]